MLTETAPLVLIIEDELMVREVLERTLSFQGLRVLIASTGRQGLELYREHRDQIALVLSNVQMPEMDGIQVLAELRDIDPGVRLCFVTGGAGLYDRETLLASGALDVIDKPFRIAELGKAVKLLVQGAAR